MIELKSMVTETRNPKTLELDAMSTKDILSIMNQEDQGVAVAVGKELEYIEKAIQLIVGAFEKGGRLIYTGAGTSGRIGLLDAVECPPTFGTKPEQVVGLIAGGESAFIKAVEGAEDSKKLGIEDLKSIQLTANDVVVGIAASGRTPYVIAGLNYAKEVGAATIAVACNKDSAVGKAAQVAIEVVPGPEVLTGSTRLKSGTSQKLVVNMLSTVSMIRVGKVYKNLMVDVQQTNEKLRVRAQNIVIEATGCEREIAKLYLDQAEGSVKLAITMILLQTNKEDAVKKLAQAQGHIRQAIVK